MVGVGITIMERGSMQEVYTVGIETDLPFDEVKRLIKELLEAMPKTEPPIRTPGVETQ